MKRSSTLAWVGTGLVALGLGASACGSSHHGAAAGGASEAGAAGASAGEGGAGAAGVGGAAGGADASQAGVSGEASVAQAGAAGQMCGDDPALATEVLAATVDPEQGAFTMTQALDGLPPGPGPLRALIQTDQGLLTCTLRPDLAPVGVANFVGLARGRRAFLDPLTKKWTRRRFYDGLLFHRALPATLIQGGDPLGTGYGGPGYAFDDEISADLGNVAGALGYANSGPNTNGSQFYILQTDQPSLDGQYTMFGSCTPVGVIVALIDVPVDSGSRPVTPEPIVSIEITRCAP